MILEEGVEQEDDQRHDSRSQGVPKSEQHRRDASERTTDRRKKVDPSDPEAEEQRVGNAKRSERDEDNDASDDRREHIPHDEA